MMSKLHTLQLKTYVCNSCNRGYQRKIYFTRHVAVCDLMSKSIKERQLENQETDDTPTVRALYDVILEITNKMEHMQRKINELSKWADLKKKKLNMVDWLNTNHSSSSLFEELLTNIKVERNHLDYLFQYDYIGTITKLLFDSLPLDKLDTHSIKAFDQKPNTLYAFTYYNTDNTSDNTSDNKTSQWAILTSLKLQELIDIASKQLLDEFIKWQKENASKMNEDDFAIKYASNVKKMMGGGMSREQLCNRVKLDLYKYLKVNIKNITEYQFE